MGAFYAMGLAVFQLAGGSLGDIWGYRRVFLWGVGIFAATGALLGFVNSVPAFLALRFVQGVGGAMFNACGLALLASAAPEGKRASYLGYSGSAVYAGIACGPPLAGLVAGNLSWRWLFWGNALACVGVFLLMRCAVRLDWSPAKDKSFDWKGCSVYAAAMTALTFGSSELADAPALAGACWRASSFCWPCSAVWSSTVPIPCWTCVFWPATGSLPFPPWQPSSTTARFSGSCFFSASICSWAGAAV